MKPQTFASFEFYATAILHTNMRVTLLGPSTAPWKAAHLQLDGLTLQWGEDGGPITFEGAVDANGWTISLPLSNQNAVIANGVHFDESSCMVLAPGAEFCVVKLSPSPWIALYIQNAVMPFKNSGMPQAAEFQMLRTSQTEIVRFVDLLRRTIETAEHNALAADSQIDLALASGELISAVRSLIAAPRRAEPRHRDSAQQKISHASIIDIAIQTLKDSNGLTVPIQELADAANVSERTLRNAFYERFGVSPHRYAKLSGLNAARRLLQTVDPHTMGVTDIATQLGFWEFGRFSNDYRVLFGELPSQTLHQRGGQQSLAAHVH